MLPHLAQVMSGGEAGVCVCVCVCVRAHAYVCVKDEMLRRMSHKCSYVLAHQES
jgi:hypothetical protein